MILGSLVAVLGLEEPTPDPGGADSAIAYFKNGSRQFAASAVRLEASIGSIHRGDTLSVLRAKVALADCRLQYKKIEFFLEYFFHSASTVYNAPPKVEVEEPEMEYAEPTGLQVIESLLYGKDAADQKDALFQQASLVSNSALDLGSLLYDFKPRDDQVLESLRFELIRVIALGITGFDAPSLKSGIRESQAALESMREILRPYPGEKGSASSGDSASLRDSISPRDSVVFYLGRSLSLLEQGRDFDSFDRMTFLTEGALPLQQYLGEWIRSIGLELNTDPALNPGAKNLFSPDAFNLDVFPHSNGSVGAAGPFLVELGRRLFFEKALSGNYSRNCASCHEPANYFTDNRPKSIAYDGHSTVKRNAPTLLYAAYQYNQFLDGRVRSLEEQVKEVMHNPMEMHADYDTVCRRLQARPDYVALYAKAFPRRDANAPDGAARGANGDGITIAGTAHGANERKITLDGIAAAIAGFVRTLAPHNADFDRYMAGDKRMLTEAQVRGFNLFMGKAQCATCHFVPLFNGLTPPLYDRSEFEVLGVPATEDFSRIKADEDSGRYAFFPISFYEGAFRTPGLRNSAVTAPYMHNGAFGSLEKVLDFYNRGGGAGLGMKLPLQTLSSTPLGLTDREQKDVLEFLHALTDRLPEFTHDPSTFTHDPSAGR